MRVLASLPFPGNVRQLENLCHWLTVMAPALVVEVKDLPPEMRSGGELGRKALAFRVPSRPEGLDAGASPGSMVGETTGNSDGDWAFALETIAAQMLAAGKSEVMDALTRRFEATVIKTALRHTGGRRIEAAQRLGIGRNTITRKIQELGLDGDEVAPSSH
jgi:two-component system nitrogen regulation response regulator GlnG